MNQTAPYGNYSAGVSYNKYNVSMPSYPPPVNQSSYYMKNASYYAQYYSHDPFAWQWDIEHRGRHVYEQEAYDWINSNMEQAWNFAVGVVEGKNQHYMSNPQCGYTGNAYDSYETRNQKRGEILTQMAQWLWDNYPGSDKNVLHKAFMNINPGDHYFLRECLAENYDGWKGTCQQYYKYAREDQMCNNWDFPNWGAYNDIGVRITDIWNYEEGIWKRTKYQPWPNYDGSLSPLMNEKQLADLLDAVEQDCYNFDTTMLHATYVQSMTHDIIKSAPYTVTGQYGEQKKPDCCAADQYCMHHSCNAIWSSGGGSGYGYESYGPKCWSINDNVPGIDYCHPQAKDPRNLQTAYLDASFIYGPNCEKAASLRSFRNGKLLVNKGYHGLYSRNVLLPDDPDRKSVV